MDYITPGNTSGNAQALLEFETMSIPTVTFTAHAVVTLQEEEMAVHA